MEKKKRKIGLGLLMTGFAAGVGAMAFAVLKQKRREEVYHEAELKAMNELDEMMGDGAECGSCTCAEECAQLDDIGEQEVLDEMDDAEEAAEPAESAESEEDPDIEVEVIVDAEDDEDQPTE